MSNQALEQVGAAVTEGILTEAMTQGYEVHDTSKEALKEKAAPAEPEPEAAPVDPLDKIIAGIETEAGGMGLEAEEEPEEMPDFEAEAEAQLLDEEIASVTEGYENEEEPETFDEQPGESNARKRAIIAEKKAAYYEKLTAARERKKWEAEALKHFPFSKHALTGITATSRRGYLKAAKEAHEAVKPYIKEAISARETQLEEERGQLAAQEEAKAQAAWGKPTTGPGSAPSAPGYEEEYEAAKRNKDLAGMIAIQMKAGTEGGES